MKSNFLREKIKKGQKVVGIWNTIASTTVTDILASSGVDFLMIDFEHGPFDIGQVKDYVNACEVYGVSPVVRVPKNSDWMMLQALDQGAHGVMVPHVEDSQDVKTLVDAVKYFPVGKRGFTPFTKAGGYKAAEKYSDEANEFTLCAALVESVEGLKNIEEIVSNKQLDIVFFGSFDISQSLGFPGDTRNPKVLEAIFKARDIAKKNGKAVGAFLATSGEDIDWLDEMGFNFIIYNVDSEILRRDVAGLVKKVKKINL